MTTQPALTTPVIRRAQLDNDIKLLIADYDACHPDAPFQSIAQLTPDAAPADETTDRYPLPNSHRHAPAKRGQIDKQTHAEMVKPYAGWLTLSDVARMTGLTGAMCNNYRKDGRLKAVDITGGVKTNRCKWFVHPDDAAAFAAWYKAGHHG